MIKVATHIGNNLLSSFYIPILINKSDLEKTLNNKIDGVIFDDKITDDHLFIKLTKVDSISLSLEGTTIDYKIPLHVWVKKEFVVGGVEAEGDIILSFQTSFNFKPDWSITAITQILSYDWIKKPKANLLGFKIPITAIAERVLETSKKSVTDIIDKQVSENFTLKEYALQAWNLLQEPILVSEDFDSRFKFTPTGLAISPFQTKEDTIISVLYFQGMTQVGIGQQNNFAKNTPLLPLQIQDFDQEKGVFMNITSEIPFEEIQNIAIKNFKDKAYSFGNHEIIIDDIRLVREGEILAIRIKTKGAYKGLLLLKGILFYNTSKNQIEIKGIEFSLDTKNLLFKSAKWLFDGLFINKLEGNLTYPLEEDITLIKTQLQKELANFKIQEGIYLKGKIEELNINNATLNAETLSIAIAAKGEVRIKFIGGK